MISILHLLWLLPLFFVAGGFVLPVVIALYWDWLDDYKEAEDE